jgi:NAD(P)-dependent dehydrogenase (short-subunit alcohol dehydrogenase family)
MNYGRRGRRFLPSVQRRRRRTKSVSILFTLAACLHLYWKKRWRNWVVAIKSVKVLKTWPSIGHLGEALDIANGDFYLASEEAKYIAGAELVIDGGITAA